MMSGERLSTHLIEIKQPKLSDADENLKSGITPTVNKNDKNLLAALLMTLVTVNRLVMHKSPATTKRIRDELVIVAWGLVVLVSLNRIPVTCTPFCHVYL